MPNAPARSSMQSSSTARTSPPSSLHAASDTAAPHRTHGISSRRSKSANVDKKERQSPTTEDTTESWYYSNWDDVKCWRSDSNSVCSSQNSTYVDLDDFDDELELEPLEKKRKSLRSVLQADEESPFENSLRSLNIGGERDPLGMSLTLRSLSISERSPLDMSLSDSYSSNKDELSESLPSFLSSYEERR